ncbi:MAG: SGNH/GDSL hydrolase family protein [Candidatus Hydrogenedentes bacterium]|nr:SGNH/GDSL hydrolase family protein [Candidatus Hydrogenedentota bacterium]
MGKVTVAMASVDYHTALAVCSWVALTSMLVGCATVRREPLQPLRADTLERLDSAKAESKDGLLWYDLSAIPVEGQGWTDTAHRYDRLPARAKGVVRDPVWDLSQHSAGLYLRFVTDSDEISFRWSLRSSDIALNHMPATGVSGLDLYARDKGCWRWVGLARPSHQENKERLIVGVPTELHEYLVYLPLYNGLDKISVGVKPSAVVAKTSPAPKAAPIVFYGTSITHGGCASRPGMSYPAMLGRRLERATINLGFSGNGTMDMEIADLMAELDPAAYVIDCVPNMTTEQVKERTQPFVERLRKARPNTPIVLVECLEQCNAWFLPALHRGIQERNAELRAAYARLKAAGTRKLHYVTSDKLIDPKTESAVDGIHPTDYGFVQYADGLEPALRCALK